MAWNKQGRFYVPTFAEGAKQKPKPSAPELAAIATTLNGRDITRGYVDANMLQQTQDAVLQARGADLRLYEEILRDDQVQATFQQRRLAVVSYAWEVTPGGDSALDKRAADSLREQLQSIRFDNITDKMLYGVFYGYAVGECLWARDGAQVALDAIVVRNRRRFGWRGDGELVLKTSTQPLGEPLPERKFWVYQTGADNDDEPYGLGLGHWLYWPTWFKRNGVKFWLIFLEKFGQPTALGKFPKAAKAGDISKLLGALDAIRTDAGIAVPEDMAVELIEAARSGTGDYTALYDRMDRAISKVTLGQTMTTDSGASRAQSETHMDVRQDLIKADADLVCESFNTSVARWLTEWNFPGAAVPRLSRRVEEAEDLNTVAERDSTLVTIGYKPTPQRVTETYGDGYEPVRPDTPVEPDTGDAAAAFAEPGDVAQDNDADQTLLDASGEQLASDWQRLLGERVEDLLALAEDSGDLVTFRERLDELARQAPPAALQQALLRSGFAAQLLGRLRGQLSAERMHDEG